MGLEWVFALNIGTETLLARSARSHRHSAARPILLVRVLSPERGSSMETRLDQADVLAQLGKVAHSWDSSGTRV